MQDPASHSNMSPKRYLAREAGIGFFLIIGTLYLVGISAFYYSETIEISETIAAHAEQYFNALDTTAQIVGAGPSLRRVVQSFSANRNIDRISIVDPRTGLVLEDSKPEKVHSHYDGSIEVGELKLDKISKIYSISMELDLIDMANPNSMPIPVIAVIKLDVSGDFRRLTQRMITASMISAILVAVSLLLIYGFVRKKLIVPIEKLEQEIREFESHAVSTYEPQSFELSSLFKNFRIMAQKVKFQQSELDRERANMAQQAKLLSLGEMAAGIAHEINNPLAIVAGSAGQLNRFKSNPEKFASKIEAIQKASGRISKIIGGLKKFSRSSQGVSYSNHSLSEIVRESLILTSIKSNRHNTPVSADFKTESLIQCDEVEIEQVIINLINNATDAVKERDEKWVKIEVAEDALSVVFRITDSGLGISEAVHNKIFEPFFTTKPVGEGTGLGLSITKGILDQHNATIVLVPHVLNTCFEIRFQKIT